jgi:hypothetical protein
VTRVRRLPLLAIVLVLAACGGSKHMRTSTAPASPRVATLYQANGWRLITPSGKPVVQHRVGGAWQASPSGQVTIAILSPKPNTTTAPIPQIAVELDAKAPIVEAGVWLDGIELPLNSGGTARRRTFYGAPVSNLPSIRHSVIAYARTARGGAAVKWVFRVK